MHDSPYRKSLEASVKYFYLSALSTGLIANGLVIAYIWLSWNQFWTIALVLSRNIHYLQSNKSLFIMMLCSIIFGFLFKLAAFPCHLWAPEIYEGSPDPITAFLILPVKIATLAIFIKLLCVTFKDAYFIWSPLIWLSSACSMIWGCLGAYNEEKIKKFLAYTSINQMGFLFLGIICCTNQSIRATIIYLVIYIAMNWGFLQIYLSTTNALTSKSIKYFTELKYFAQYNWNISIGFIFILFSMAGIPPLAGFFGKYFLFLTTFQAEYIGLVCIGMLTSLVSAFYYLRVMKILLFDELRVHRMNINSLKLINSMPLTYKIVFSTTVLFLALYLLVNQIIFNLAHEMLTACLILY
jgi:NADH-quinone oxidoreductase subunit N